ncbi:zinc-binding dehydrogenase [Conexibacter sp. SYSU D00693]|uniref:zinc-binding dehydrogenase n=1 Tax=Conexibacter sp. SYSU D00693 TaxID=2812560 RepID=UPI00196AA4CF|nr:zinc-binding dehydrogenase [Conexibacter sp. SYSU D00693]
MKVRGAVLREMGLPAPYARSRPLAVEEVELDGPGRGEVLVRIRAAGLCHSDLSVVDGSRPRVMPMLLGHEAAGVVEQVGDGVTGLAAGDHVVFAFVPSCGHCGPCAGGRPALCEPGATANTAGTLLGGERRLRDLHGAPINHHLGVSALAEAAVVSERSCVKVDDDLPFEVAALFGCAITTGAGAVVNTAHVAPGESVAVVGLGGVGLAALLGALAAGAHPVVGVDVVEAKLELARALGAAEAVQAGPEAVEQVRALLHGGAHHVIETVGNERALADAYAMTRRGGTTVTVGLPHPDRQFTVPAVSLVAEERTVKGSYMGSAVPSRDVPRMIALHRAGRLAVDRLLTHTLELDEVNVALDRLASGEAVRQVVVLPEGVGRWP